MHIKHLISAAAIALVAGLGSASADEEFATLNGISAARMGTQDMLAVRGGLSLGFHNARALLWLDEGLGPMALVALGVMVEHQRGLVQAATLVEHLSFDAP